MSLISHLLFDFLHPCSKTACTGNILYENHLWDCLNENLSFTFRQFQISYKRDYSCRKWRKEIFLAFFLIVRKRSRFSATCIWSKEPLYLVYDPRPEKIRNRACALSEISDQPMHLAILARAFVFRPFDSLRSKNSFIWTVKAQIRLRKCAYWSVPSLIVFAMEDISSWCGITIFL